MAKTVHRGAHVGMHDDLLSQYDDLSHPLDEEGVLCSRGSADAWQSRIG